MHRESNNQGRTQRVLSGVNPSKLENFADIFT